MVQRILVVDDNRELQKLVRSALEHKGYDVLTAGDAVQGLELIARGKIDVALLDVIMPGMDGLTMLSHLREHKDNLRVIIMTALNTPETPLVPSATKRVIGSGSPLRFNNYFPRSRRRWSSTRVIETLKSCRPNPNG
jgi:CheY-like chemotaxis protein